MERSTVFRIGVLLITVVSAVLVLVAESALGDACVPGKVTCCFTINNALHKVYVNNEDITDKVTPRSAFTKWMIPKVVTFDEPLRDSVLAFEGYDFHARSSSPEISGMQLSCASTREGSPWNFVSTPEENWTSVESTSWNRFPDNWYRHDFKGPALQVVESSSGFTLDWAQCGVSLEPSLTSRARRVAAQPSKSERRVFSFKREVKQSLTCDVSAPSKPISNRVSSDECVAGMVTCCMTADNIIAQVFVNGVDVTSRAQPNDDLALSDWTTVKEVTFREPVNSAVIAVKAGERDGLARPFHTGVQIMCTSTRSDSPWNGLVTDVVVETESSAAWEAVVPNNEGIMAVEDADFPQGWFSNSYSGPRRPVVASRSKFHLKESKCGIIDRFRKIVINASDTYKWYAVRKQVVQPRPCRVPSDAPADPVAGFSIRAIFDAPVVADVNFSTSTPRHLGGFGPVAMPGESVRRAVAAGVSFWQSMMLNTFPSRVCLNSSLSSPPLCGGYLLPSGGMGCIDDLAVFVNVETENSTMSADLAGDAAVCLVDPTGRPRVSRVHFNLNRIEGMSQAELDALARHLLGHALGLGTLWEEYGFTFPSSGMYMGELAASEFRTRSNQPSAKGIPLDQARVHWDAPSSLLGADLMAAGNVLDISRVVSSVTRAALNDLRYDVAITQNSQTTTSGRRRLDEEVAQTDIVALFLQTATSSEVSIKPGREADYEADLSAKRDRDRKKLDAIQREQQGTGLLGVLGVGGVIGIAIGGTALLAVVGAVAYISRNRRQRRPSSKARTAKRKHASYLSSPSSQEPGWIERFDEETNQKYWLNRLTGEFSWDNPASASVPLDDSAIITVQPQEQTFYHVADTPASPSWTDPESAKSPALRTVSSASIKRLRSPSAVFRKSIGSSPREPDTWTETFDAMTGTRYWLNKKTGEFSWSMPQTDLAPHSTGGE